MQPGGFTIATQTLSGRTRRRGRIISVVAGFFVVAAAVSVLLIVFTAGPARAKEFSTLHIYGGTVQVDIQGSGYAAAHDGQALHDGDVVHTGPDGRAQIQYFDGSDTRLDYNTTFRLTELSTIENSARSKVITADQTGGQTYNRVTKLTDSESRVSVSTPTATASVQGTVFLVSTISEDRSEVFVFEGLVAVEVGTHTVLVPSGHKVIVFSSGAIGPVVELTDADLNRAFIRFNQCTVDRERKCAKTKHHSKPEHHTTHQNLQFYPPSP